MSKYDAIRRHHAKRPILTARKLMEALERMQSGRTIHLPADFAWTKKNWSKEAGVNINTVVKKMDGKFVFAEANAVFEQGEAPLENSSLKECRLRIAALQSQVARLLKELRDARDA